MQIFLAINGGSIGQINFKISYKVKYFAILSLTKVNVKYFFFFLNK